MGPWHHQVVSIIEVFVVEVILSRSLKTPLCLKVPKLKTQRKLTVVRCLPRIPFFTRFGLTTLALSFAFLAHPQGTFWNSYFACTLSRRVSCGEICGRCYVLNPEIEQKRTKMGGKNERWSSQVPINLCSPTTRSMCICWDNGVWLIGNQWDTAQLFIRWVRVQ